MTSKTLTSPAAAQISARSRGPRNRPVGNDSTMNTNPTRYTLCSAVPTVDSHGTCASVRKVTNQATRRRKNNLPLRPHECTLNAARAHAESRLLPLVPVGADTIRDRRAPAKPGNRNRSPRPAVPVKIASGEFLARTGRHQPWLPSAQGEVLVLRHDQVEARSPVALQVEKLATVRLRVGAGDREAETAPLTGIDTGEPVEEPAA
jgi:hypothetical protein